MTVNQFCNKVITFLDLVHNWLQLLTAFLRKLSHFRIMIPFDFLTSFASWEFDHTICTGTIPLTNVYWCHHIFLLVKTKFWSHLTSNGCKRKLLHFWFLLQKWLRIWTSFVINTCKLNNNHKTFTVYTVPSPFPILMVNMTIISVWYQCCVERDSYYYPLVSERNDVAFIALITLNIELYMIEVISIISMKLTYCDKGVNML